MYDTIALSTDWDLMLTGTGDLAVQQESDAIAQDVASAVQTYQGEVWFDTTVGVPYFTSIFGQTLNQPLFSAIYNAVALTVPNVVAAQTTFEGLTVDRKLIGTVQVIDTNGAALNVSF